MEEIETPVAPKDVTFGPEDQDYREVLEIGAFRYTKPEVDLREPVEVVAHLCGGLNPEWSQVIRAWAGVKSFPGIREAMDLPLDGAPWAPRTDEELRAFVARMWDDSHLPYWAQQRAFPNVYEESGVVSYTSLTGRTTLLAAQNRWAVEISRPLGLALRVYWSDGKLLLQRGFEAAYDRHLGALLDALEGVINPAGMRRIEKEIEGWISDDREERGMRI